MFRFANIAPSWQDDVHDQNCLKDNINSICYAILTGELMRRLVLDAKEYLPPWK